MTQPTLVPPPPEFLLRSLGQRASSVPPSAEAPLQWLAVALEGRCRARGVSPQALQRLPLAQRVELVRSCVRVIEECLQPPSAPPPTRKDSILPLPAARGGATVVLRARRPSALLFRVRRSLQLSYLHDGLSEWDFPVPPEAQSFAVERWTPERPCSAGEVRAHFESLGCEGVPAAFLVWLAEASPHGTWFCVPSATQELPRNRSGAACVPFFSDALGSRVLSLRAAHSDFDEGSCFVAFRRI